MWRALLLAGLPAAAGALDVGSSEFVYVSDLSAQGYTPFATSGVGQTVFGMTNGTDLYLCFAADKPGNQNERLTAMRAEIAGENPDRTVPNIPIVCIMTQ